MRIIIQVDLQFPKVTIMIYLTMEQKIGFGLNISTGLKLSDGEYHIIISQMTEECITMMDYVMFGKRR